VNHTASWRNASGRRISAISCVVLIAALTPLSIAGAQAFSCQGEPATIVGTTGDDRIVGTNGRDVIVSLGGADVINGKGGNDLICSGWGPDVVAGGEGTDRIFGGPGNDQLTGGAGGDHLAGGPGRDTLIGNTGADTLVGGLGADSLMGGFGNDILRGGFGPDRVVGGDGADSLDGGVGRDTCAIDDSNVGCEQATAATRLTPQAGAVDRVIHISIDGLRSDYVNATFTPTLREMQRSGTSTLNARNDPAKSNTLPNHTSQITGRPVEGPTGHGVDFNEDSEGTIHDEAGEYVASVFDVAHDRGLVTAVYTGKEKFDLHERSWDGTFGAVDRTGADNGRDKIDVYVRDSPERNAQTLITDLDRTDLGRTDAYIFFHIRLPDSAGHAHEWGSNEYAQAVRESDAIVGQIKDHIESNAQWASSTAFIVTSDHGGPIGETSHYDIDKDENYRIPFIVDAPGVKPASDLYVLNPTTRQGPGSGHPDLNGVQPVRAHEAGNLGLQLLGLPPIPGSTFNALHDLRLN